MGKFSEGFNYYLKNIQSNVLGSEQGSEYIQTIEEEIKKLQQDINSFKDFQTDTTILKGDVFEFFSADTFNINAAVRGSDNRAYVLRSNAFGSPDILTGDGIKFSLKAYKNAVASVKAQAVTIWERFKEYQAKGGTDDFITYLEDRGYTDDQIANDVVYSQQQRLIPQDQIEIAIEWLKRKIAKELKSRPDQVNRYIDTLKSLTGKVFDKYGNESDPITNDELIDITQKAKKGEFSSEKQGYTVENLVTNEYILKQAMYAGLNAVVYSVLLKLVPEIINMIKTGQIDLESLKDKGKQIVSESPEDFLRGGVAAAITIMCKTGRFGETVKNCEPATIAFATIIAFNVLKDAVAVGEGTMTRTELVDNLCRNIFIMGLARAVPAMIPAIGTIFGSLVGTVIAIVAYNHMKDKAISFCAESGFTLFGMVDQNYELPREVLENLNLSTLDINLFEPNEFAHKEFQPNTFKVSSFQPKTIGFSFYKRGKIGYFKVGYVKG